MKVLLDRDRFREMALTRDGYRCVICGGREGLSVHHIIERKLFVDGGYYINNAATLCEQHHLEAEKTVLTVEAVRNSAKIIGAIVPPQLDASRRYDKWGQRGSSRRDQAQGAHVLRRWLPEGVEGSRLAPPVFSSRLRQHQNMTYGCHQRRFC